jgi:hypothetical protein
VRANRLIFPSQKLVGTLAIPGYQEVLEADIAPLRISGARLEDVEQADALRQDRLQDFQLLDIHELERLHAWVRQESLARGDGTDGLPATMRQILSKRLTVRGFINCDFAAEHYADFLREVGAGIASGRIRYREDIVDGLENAPGAFIGMLEGRNFGKLIVRVAA